MTRTHRTLVAASAGALFAASAGKTSLEQDSVRWSAPIKAAEIKGE